MMVPFLATSRDDSADASQPSTQPTAQEIATLAGKRAVIVEDEGITQIHLRKILTRAGLQVVGYALSGAEGVETVLRLTPDIVLMDINMPGEINGLEAARQILRQYPVCVVMVTAYTDHRAEAEAMGASGYATKPVESRTLLLELQRAWARFHRH